MKHKYNNINSPYNLACTLRGHVLREDWILDSEVIRSSTTLFLFKYINLTNLTNFFKHQFTKNNEYKTKQAQRLTA